MSKNQQFNKADVLLHTSYAALWKTEKPTVNDDKSPEKLPDNDDQCQKQDVELLTERSQNIHNDKLECDPNEGECGPGDCYPDGASCGPESQCSPEDCGPDAYSNDSTKTSYCQ